MIKQFFKIRFTIVKPISATYHKKPYYKMELVLSNMAVKKVFFDLHIIKSIGKYNIIIQNY